MITPLEKIQNVKALDAHRIEWDILSQLIIWAFSSCWKEADENCSNNNEQFDLMEGDLHNLTLRLEKSTGIKQLHVFQWTNEPEL